MFPDKDVSHDSINGRGSNRISIPIFLHILNTAAKSAKRLQTYDNSDTGE